MSCYSLNELGNVHSYYNVTSCVSNILMPSVENLKVMLTPNCHDSPNNFVECRQYSRVKFVLPGFLDNSCAIQLFRKLIE